MKIQQKVYLCALFLFVSSVTYSQVKEGQELTYKDTQDPTRFQSIKNGTEISRYTASNGAVLSVGDTLILGRPSASESSSKLGFGAVNTKSAARFSTIIYGKPAGFGNVMAAMGGETPNNPGTEMINQVVKIVEITAYHQGSKKKPLIVSVLLGEQNGRAFGINKYMYLSNFENSMSLGEIKTKNTPLTSDEALAELKKAKDKFDLDLITEGEYNQIRERLKQFIK